MRPILRDLVFLAWLAIPLIAAVAAIRHAGDRAPRYEPPARWDYATAMRARP